MNLSQLKKGNTAILRDFSKESAVYFTLSSLGILTGDQIEVIARAPFGGPISLRYGKDTFFALRLNHAKKIKVELVNEK